MLVTQLGGQFHVSANPSGGSCVSAQFMMEDCGGSLGGDAISLGEFRGEKNDVNCFVTSLTNSTIQTRRRSRQVSVGSGKDGSFEVADSAYPVRSIKVEGVCTDILSTTVISENQLSANQSLPGPSSATLKILIVDVRYPLLIFSKHLHDISKRMN